MRNEFRLTKQRPQLDLVREGVPTEDVTRPFDQFGGHVRDAHAVDRSSLDQFVDRADGHLGV